MTGFEDTYRTVGFTLLRFGAYVSNALILGMIPILFLVLRPAFAALTSDDWDAGRARLSERIEGVLRVCLLVSLAATALILLLQSTVISELGTGELQGDSVLAVLDTRFGQWHVLRIAVLLALLMLLPGNVRSWALRRQGDPGRGPHPIWWISWGTLGTLLLVSHTFSGHATVVSQNELAIVNDVVHLIAGATWFSGIVVLAVLLPDGWLGQARERRLELLAPVVSRFSRVALVSIAVVFLTGTVNSLLHVGHLADLWSTSYGETLAVKLELFAGILVLGGINHYLVGKRLAAALAAGKATAAQLTFRKTIAAELVIALGIMLVTGLLVGLARTGAL